MNKLVSKSPIQRFKQGRKIIKAQRGNQFIYYTGRDGINYEAWRSGDDWYYRQKGGTGMTRIPYNYTTTTGQRFYNSTPRGAIANTYDVVNNMSKTSKATPIRTKTVIFPEEVDPNYTHNFLEALRAGYRPNRDGTQKAPNNVAPVSSTEKNTSIPVNNRWVNGVQKRDEITDVRATQQMLKDAGFDIGKYGVDGKWGRDTENAYKKYLLNKEKPVVAPTQEEIQQVLPQIAKQAQPTLVTQTLLNQTPKLTNFTPLRTGTFNKSQIRNLISERLGQNAYNYTGAQRKALRQYLNGESDDTSLLTNGLEKFIISNKQGGQLVSKNPIIRFKNKKK